MLTVPLCGEAMDVLQTLPQEEMENYKELMKKLEKCYGHAHLKKMYKSQMKSRWPKVGGYTFNKQYTFFLHNNNNNENDYF